MKRALVISLICVFGLGIGAAAQSLTGAWETDIVFTLGGAGDAVSVSSLTSVLDVDYALSGWTFGFNAFVNATELFDLNFDLSGVLGAFSLYSFIDFDPANAGGTQTPSFVRWEGLTKVSIAGVELWGGFVLQDTTPGVGQRGDASGMGAGFTVGGHGSAGDIEIWASVDFNLAMWGATPMTWIQIYGWDILHDYATYLDCSDGVWYSGVFNPIGVDCDPDFSNLDIVIMAPFTCLDFIVWVNFDCTYGFDYIQFDLNDIDLGAGWFQLDDLNVKFTTLTKTVSTDFTLTFGSAVCVTPYFDLVQDGLFTITGVELQALLLSYSYNGVTIKAGEIFTYYVGFDKLGNLKKAGYEDCTVTGADEFIGVWFEGDSCCGGLTSASVVMFFDSNLLAASTSTGIFDFVLISADVEVGIGSGFSVKGGLEVSDTGLDNLSIGFSFSF